MAIISPLRPNVPFTDPNGILSKEGYDFLFNLYARVGGSLSSLNAATLETYTWEEPGTIGSTTPSTGKFTTIQSTVASGTAPFTVASATKVTNLYADRAALADVATTATSSGNASTVTTNANLTGVITSVGNATSIASQTGTGTKFVVDNGPTLIAPILGAATATSVTATGTFIAYNATVIPAGGTTGSGLKVSSTANFGIFFGSGVPTLSAAKGSLYLRSDGSTTNDRAYINTSGSTTWTALTTVA